MTQPVIVYKGRTTVLQVSVGYDISEDQITSEIRAGKYPTSTLIATWIVQNRSDGKDGELLLILDDAVSAEITKTKGYMDLKRVTGGEPVPVFDDPLEVLFKEVVTA